MIVKEWYEVKPDGTKERVLDSYWATVVLGAPHKLPVGAERTLRGRRFVLAAPDPLDFDDGEWEVLNNDRHGGFWMFGLGNTLKFPYGEDEV